MRANTITSHLRGNNTKYFQRIYPRFNPASLSVIRTSSCPLVHHLFQVWSQVWPPTRQEQWEVNQWKCTWPWLGAVRTLVSKLSCDKVLAKLYRASFDHSHGTRTMARTPSGHEIPQRPFFRTFRHWDTSLYPGMSEETANKFHQALKFKCPSTSTDHTARSGMYPEV